MQPCAICGQPARVKYCSRACQNRATVQSAAFHAAQERRATRRAEQRRVTLKPCGWCGEAMHSNRTDNPVHKRCRPLSLRPAPRSPIPDDHPSRWIGDVSPVRYSNCGWCERLFVVHGSTHAYCSTDCKVRAKRCRRRGREAGDYGYWTWGDFMRIAQRFSFCCAYCGAKPDRLDPDHVVPVSRGGPNTLTNLLPACLSCNSDKRDLLLSEWDADRRRRRLPPRATSCGSEDRRYRHLTSTLAA